MDENDQRQEPQKGTTFVVTFTVDDGGIVNIKMDWPAASLDKQLKDNIANLLYTINSGGLKTLCVKALYNMSENDHSAQTIVSDIITQWLEYTTDSEGGPCVKPRNALRK
tara:strand:- start:295 stop:624 length:330 start_codon:yes stop_codon:yes gene_type:complete